MSSSKSDSCSLAPTGVTQMILATVLLAAVMTASVSAAEWQWSVPDGTGRAYLWIPPDCKFVRGVVLANHNMIEQGILQHPAMRSALASIGFAQVWVVPKLEMEFDFHKGAGEHFQKVMDSLAAASGYAELRTAPVVPMGHSACATFPWNFAAWNPGRTLCILSIHGDAPKTDLTGYGRANINWEDRKIDGVPGLMVMGEYEWWEDRLTPAMAFKRDNPKATIALLADAGHGHFDYSDELVAFLAMFIQKSTQHRLPDASSASTDAPVQLKPVDPASGWLIDRWRKDRPPTAPAAPFAAYSGSRDDAFWCFDEEMANATEQYYAVARGKKPQMIGFVQGDHVLAGEPCNPNFVPLDDGITFPVTAKFLDIVEGNGGNPEKWSGLPKGTPLGHATTEGIRISRIVGPAAIAGPNQLRLWLDRSVYTKDERNNDAWILASHPGDKEFKSAVQQAMIRFNPNTQGKRQEIHFPKIADVTDAVAQVELAATSDAGLPVHYYIVEGPVEAEGSRLKLTKIPPRALYPVRVTVVAWQWGLPESNAAGAVQTAEPVAQTYFIQKAK